MGCLQGSPFAFGARKRAQGDSVRPLHRPGSRFNAGSETCIWEQECAQPEFLRCCSWQRRDKVEQEGNGPTGPTNSGFRSSSGRTTTSTHTVIRDHARVAGQGTSSRPSSRLKAVMTNTRTTDGTLGSPSSGVQFPRRRSCRIMRPMGNPTCSWRRVRCFASSDRKAAHEICRAVTTRLRAENRPRAAPRFSCSGHLMDMSLAVGNARCGGEY
jgi:hypothetical protein